MRKLIRDFLYFPKGDRRAVLALGCIAVFCIGVLVIADAIKGMEGSVGVVDEHRVDAHDNVYADERGQLSNDAVSLDFFDPNTVDSLTLVRYGIKSWKVRNFLHYRAAGKVFRSADDMGYTYGWSDDDVAMLAPYVLVDAKYRKMKNVSNNANLVRESMGTLLKKNGQMVKSEAANSSSKFKTLTKIDVNTADSTTLCRIPGVGSGISSAILRYRTRLGGFYSTSQLLEISIFSPELQEWFTVSDTVPLTKLPINRSSFQILNSHPYITYEQTRSLLKYIRVYGSIKDEHSLRSTGIFTAEEMDKLRPYMEY